MSDTINYGHTASKLSAITGVPQGEIALQVAAVLGGIGGAMSGLITAGAEFQHPTFSLINLAGDSPRLKHLQYLLLEPLSQYQRQWREHSQATPLSALKLFDTQGWLPDSAADQALLNRTEYDGQMRDEKHMEEQAEVIMEGELNRGPWSENPDPIFTGHPTSRLGTSTNLTANYRYSQMLRQPSFMLDRPDPGQMCKMLTEVHDRSPLIVDRDGALLETLFHRNVSSKTIHTQQSLLQVVTGGDESFAPFRSNQGPGSTQTVSGALISSLTLEAFKELSPGNDGPDAMHRLLQHTLLTGRSGEAPSPTYDEDSLHMGYRYYRDCLKSMLIARRSGRGYTLELDKAGKAAWLKEQSTFIDRLEQVPAYLRSYTAHLWSLPSSVCWAFMSLLWKNEEATWCMKSAMHLANQALDQHVQLLESVISHRATTQLEQAAAKMLRHIEELEPCLRRNVYRKYPKQARALHDPALDHLIAQGKVVFIDDRRIATAEWADKKEAQA